MLNESTWLPNVSCGQDNCLRAAVDEARGANRDLPSHYEDNTLAADYVITRDLPRRSQIILITLYTLTTTLSVATFTPLSNHTLTALRGIVSIKNI